jgi:hypothetical protein
MSEATTVDPEESAELTKGEIFDVLRNQRRRFVLQYLKYADGPVELGDLATQVAAWEYETTTDEVSSEQRKRVYTTLQQTHLEKMHDAGIVAYDADAGLISATDQTDDLNVYLEIVPGREFAWREYYLALGGVSCALVAVLYFEVFPFTAVADVVWAGVIAGVLTLSAVIHIYRERDMRLGSAEQPPEFRAED